MKTSTSTKKIIKQKPGGEFCIWDSSSLCGFASCVGEKCDLHSLPFIRRDINRRIKKEGRYVWNNKFSKDKSVKAKCNDKLKGINVLIKALKVLNESKNRPA